MTKHNINLNLIVYGNHRFEDRGIKKDVAAVIADVKVIFI